MPERLTTPSFAATYGGVISVMFRPFATVSTITSASTPLVASAVVCLVQAHPEWSVERMREQLFTTADYYVAHGTHEPTFVSGFGIVDADAAARQPPIPTVSEWGMVAMTVLTLTAGTLVYTRRRPARA